MIEKKTDRERYTIEDGLFRLEYTTGYYYDTDSANETVEWIEEFLEEHQVRDIPIIVSANACNPKFTFEARRVFASEEFIKRYLCVAIVAENHIQKLLGSMYIAMNKPNVPAKLFDTEELALVWIKEVKSLASVEV